VVVTPSWARAAVARRSPGFGVVGRAAEAKLARAVWRKLRRCMDMFL
jgi:hypothetical protein